MVCELLGFGAGDWGEGGSWFLQPAGVVLLLNPGVRAVPRSGVLRLPANHLHTLAPEAWKDECFACWNKRSSEIWPDPVKGHEIA